MRTVVEIICWQYIWVAPTILWFGVWRPHDRAYERHLQREKDSPPPSEG